MMLRFPLIALIASLAACASTGEQPATPPPEPTSTAPITGPAFRIVELPGAPGPGQPKETKVLIEEQTLKLGAIVLRQGTVLPEHHAPVPVTIMALSGAGVVTIGGERLRIDPTHAVYLAPGVPHAVIPDEGSDLVLLVHHLGRAQAHHP